MSRPLRVELPGGVYHVIVRGNERRDIFRDVSDREAYLRRLAICRERFGFFVYAYCLMSNHVHLAIERGPVALSRIMLTLQSPYAQRFNKRHDRVGHLFQGRYRAFLVEKERYLLALIRYIHWNPVEAGLASSPSRYRWSSDRYYRSGAGPQWLDSDRVMRLLARRRSAAIACYRDLVDGKPSSSYEEVPAIARAIKGDEEFAERSLLGAGKPARPKRAWTVEELAAAVAAAQGLTVAELRRRGQLFPPSRARSIAALIGRREAGIPVSQMAEYFGRDESTLQRGVLRLESALARDDDLRARVEQIAAMLGGKSTGVQR